MDKEIGSALIGAGGGLLGGLFSAAAAAEERKRKMLSEAQDQDFQAKTKSAENLGNSQQKAFESLMAGYRSSLLR
jgi:hypothetical protein